jgi:hypothetical protein
MIKKLFNWLVFGNSKTPTIAICIVCRKPITPGDMIDFMCPECALNPKLNWYQE